MDKCMLKFGLTNPRHVVYCPASAMAASNLAFDGNFKNTEDFLHVVFPRLWSKYSEISPTCSVILWHTVGILIKTMFYIFGGNSV